MKLLAVAGGADVAAIAGLVLQAAARRTPLLLDGVVAAAGALVANQTQPRASRWWRAAQGTAEPGQQIALRSLGLTPLLDLGVSAGDGTGGLLALQLLRAAVAATSA
jgi:nicotinate-nucleotide--dimethylbenzimidazole phosphoribosyltransferase